MAGVERYVLYRQAGSLEYEKTMLKHDSIALLLQIYVSRGFARLTIIDRVHGNYKLLVRLHIYMKEKC